MNKITVLNDFDGDLSALYVNGKFIYSNHSIGIDDIVGYTPIELIEDIDLSEVPGWENFSYSDFPEGQTLDEFLESIEKNK